MNQQTLTKALASSTSTFLFSKEASKISKGAISTLIGIIKGCESTDAKGSVSQYLGGGLQVIFQGSNF